MFQYRNQVQKEIPFRIKATQTNHSNLNTMLSNVHRATVILSTTEIHTQSKQKPSIVSKTSFEKFSMEIPNKNMVLSVGCVMCASNFTCKDESIVTACGHLYHRKCLHKWFESLRDLNPNGHMTCPDCRTVIADMKPVYLHYTAPDDIKSQFNKMSKKTERLDRLLQRSKSELKKIQQQLTSEKAKNKRLTSKIGAIEKKFKAATKYSCYQCESSSGNWKISATKQTTKVTTVEAASSCGTRILTKKLRNREYNYTI